jgi:hypothetical protein
MGDGTATRCGSAGEKTGAAGGDSAFHIHDRGRGVAACRLDETALSLGLHDSLYILSDQRYMENTGHKTGGLYGSSQTKA